MVETDAYVGASVCHQGDVRVTTFGRFLRRTKLNEFPQLINILKGEMSFVGPRPEAPDLAELYPPEAKVLFSVKPGLVGPAQLLYRNEEELYPDGVDHKDYYINHILPDKLNVDFKYVLHPSIFKDIKYICLAIKETVFGVITKKHFFENLSQIYLFLLDVVAILGSYFLAIKLRFDVILPATDWEILVKVLPILLLFRISIFIWSGLYGVLIRYLNLHNYLPIVKAVTFSTLLTITSVYLLGYRSFPRSILIIDWFILNSLMVLIRVSGKLIRDKLYRKETSDRKRVLIYGAGKKGILAANWLRDSVEIIGFLDDNRAKRQRRIDHYRVLGGRYDLEPLARIYPIEEVIIAISNLDGRNLKEIISLCYKASVKYTIFTAALGSYSDRTNEEYIRNRKIVQWIGGEELQVDSKQLKVTFSDKGVLLLGPSSTLGNELLKNLSFLNTGEITLLDRYESYLNETLQRSLKFIPNQKLRPIFSSDPLPNSVERILSEERPPEIVMHMGTRKYPYSMKVDPICIVRENIIDTWDLLQLARKAGCELFTMTSSINAANPVNFIQATLRLAESYLQSAACNSTIRNSVVRLYNLLDNRGSLLRRVQDQLRDGRKILLNHPDEEKYFLTASAAAKSVLASASIALDGGGDGNNGIYIPILNGKVKVLDLTKNIIRDCGLDPDRDVEIEYVGSDNPGEWKEGIKFDGQKLRDTAHENVKRLVSVCPFSDKQVEDDIGEFRELVENEDRDGLARKVDQVLRWIQDAGEERL
jgi:FlaA1/EpsC-like NDP-sugar epimerase